MLLFIENQENPYKLSFFLFLIAKRKAQFNVTFVQYKLF